MDLTTMTFPQLRELQAQLLLAIKEREKEEKAKAKLQILAIAQNAGISLRELIETSKGQFKKTVAVRYQHPSDASLRWTGRGRKPLWVEKWVASGYQLNDIDIIATRSEKSASPQ